MTAVQRKANELHEELADYYRQFRGITVTNTHTEALWKEIEKWEAQS